MQILFVFLTIWLSCLDALEEPSPEVFLQPRHFNPHPYELDYDADEARENARLREYAKHIDIFANDHNRGPVLFPTPSQPNVLQQLKETHPYAGVVARKKLKYRFGMGRFTDTSQRPNSPIFKALAAHGAKVLRVPHAKDLKNSANFKLTYDNNEQNKKNYAFSYKVVDDFTGDDFSHRESQNSQATNGEYRVKLPDGRLQIVSYTADDEGYKADVRYAERTSAGPAFIFEPSVDDHHLSVLSPPPPPRAPPGTLSHVPIYTGSLLALKSHTHDFINQQLIAKEQVAPEAGSRHDPHSRLIVANKYRTQFTSTANIHEEKVGQTGKFIAGTLAPYTLSTLATRLHELSTAAAKYELPPAAKLHHRARP